MSRLALGTMTWGEATDEYEAGDILAAYLDAGGNVIDTADLYGGGASEEIVGKLLDERGQRGEVVLATKAATRWGTERRFDASRIHILRRLEESLRRLRTDVIDLWQMHVWDGRTPVEETLSAADDAVRAGKVRYVGVSNYSGWQLMEAGMAGRGSFPRAQPVAAQMEYSLIERGIEREVTGAAERLGIGILAWSPLGRGVLTGKYRGGAPTGSRATDPRWSHFVSHHMDDASALIVEAACTAADGLGVSPAQLALAWVCDRPGVVGAVIGPRTQVQLRPMLDAASLELPEAIKVALDEVSAPVMGYPEAGRFQR